MSETTYKPHLIGSRFVTVCNFISCTGTASVVVTYPFDIMRTQFALQGKNVVFKSMASFIAHTYKTTGVKGKQNTYIL